MRLIKCMSLELKLIWSSPIKNTYVTQFPNWNLFQSTFCFWVSIWTFSINVYYRPFYFRSTSNRQFYFLQLTRSLSSLSLSLSLSLFLALLSLPFMSQRHTGYLAHFSLCLSARVPSFNSVARSVLTHKHSFHTCLCSLSLSLSLPLSLSLSLSLSLCLSWHWLWRVFSMIYVAQATLCFVSLGNNLLTGLERQAEIHRIWRLNSLLLDFGWK